MENAPETTERSYWKKLPMSVLLAIYAEINKSNLAQIQAAEMEIEVTDQLRLQLLMLAAMNSDFEIKAWIKRELEAHHVDNNSN